MSCNMNCKYCYNGTWGVNGNTLPVEDACRLMELAARKYRRVWITFFGGEPSITGVRYYQDFYDFQSNLIDKYGTEFVNIFQTNGLSLDHEWIGLFMKHNVMISVSYDGLHHSELRGHCDIIYRNLLLLRQNNCSFRVFCVETASTAPQMLDNYKHFRDNEFDYKIIPVSPHGQAQYIVNLSNESSIIVDELINVYKYWLTDKHRKNTMFTFREFLQLDRNTKFAGTYLYGRLALNFDSKVYPFGRPNDIQFQLGDLSVNDIDDYFATEKYHEIVTLLENEKEKRCSICSSQKMCGGACIDGAMLYGNEASLIDYTCEQGRLIDDKVLIVNEQVKRDIAIGNIEKYHEDVTNILLTD